MEEFLVWLVPAVFAGILVYGVFYEFRSSTKDREGKDAERDL
jgi:hypothetical protein